MEYKKAEQTAMLVLLFDIMGFGIVGGYLSKLCVTLPHMSILSWHISMDADRTGTPQGGAARVRRHKYFAQQNLGAGAIHLPRAYSIPLGWSDHRERNPKIRPSAFGRWSYFWRSGWDSNPREVSLKLISS